MAEAAIFLSLIDGSAGLLIKCGSVIKTLHDLADKFKKAELNIKAMGQQVDIIKAAWSHIRNWSVEYQSDASRIGLQLLMRLDQALEVGDQVISGLKEDLVPYKGEKRTLGLRQRSKFIWNDTSLSEHRTRLRDQITAVTLLLNVIQLYVAYFHYFTSTAGLSK